MRITRSRVIAVVATIGMLAVAVCGVRLSEAGPDAQIIKGQPGQELRLREGTLTVTEVRVGTKLTYLSDTTTTTGMFAVVQVRGTAPGREPFRIGNPKLLTTGGPTYTAFSSGNTLAVKPGFAQTIEVAFELDPARITDLTLTMEPVEIVSGYQQHIQVNLGITADNAAGWVAAARGRTVEAAAEQTSGLP